MLEREIADAFKTSTGGSIEAGNDTQRPLFPRLKQQLFADANQRSMPPLPTIIGVGIIIPQIAIAIG